MTPVRTARCSCGSLDVSTRGDPAAMVACHCRECQRRTGAPFGVGAYFERSAVTVTGPSRVHQRSVDAGRALRFHFCGECGSTVYRGLDFYPEAYGVSVGALAHPDFPAPSRSVWETTRHPWIGFPQAVECYQGARPRPQTA